MAGLTLHDFFKNLNYTLSEETSKYLDSLSEVNLKLLVKRIYESNELVKNELNRQVKLTNYNNIQEVVQGFDREETVKFVNWLSENVFGTTQLIEAELDKILIKG
jgi:hypothetical protein